MAVAGDLAQLGENLLADDIRQDGVAEGCGTILRAGVSLCPHQEIDDLLCLDAISHGGGVQDDVGVTGDRPGAITGAIHNRSGQFISKGTRKFGHGGIDGSSVGGDGLASLVYQLRNIHAVGESVSEFNITDGIGVGNDLCSHTRVALATQAFARPLNGGGAAGFPIRAE